MAYRYACLRRNFQTVAVCCSRTKGWSPVIRSSWLSILDTSASTSFNKDGVAMFGSRSPMSSAAVSKARCSTNSCCFLEALARASQMGGRSLASVNCTRFNRLARLAPKYSVVTLLSFFSWTFLFYNRVSLRSTATSPTVSAMQVPAAWLMLGSVPGRWLRSSRWRCWKRSASGKSAETSGTMSTELVFGMDRMITAHIQSMLD